MARTKGTFGKLIAYWLDSFGGRVLPVLCGWKNKKDIEKLGKFWCLGNENRKCC
jgi:hypothetical protein